MRSIAALVTMFYRDLWNRWDDTLVEDVSSPDFEFRGSLGEATTGHDGWRGYRDRVRAGSPDFHNEVVELVVEGERAAARLRYSGTHAGVMLGAPASGRHFGYDGAAFFAATGGQLVRAWVLGDVHALLPQLRGG